MLGLLIIISLATLCMYGQGSSSADVQSVLDDSWPSTVTLDGGGSALVYQPQVVSWPGRQRLNTRIAMALSPAGVATPILGTVDVRFTTTTDIETRWASLTNPKLTSTSFPASSAAQEAVIQAQILQ